MSFIISSAVSLTVHNTDLNQRSTVLNQVVDATAATASPITVTAVDPQTTGKRVTQYLTAMETNFRTGQDAKDVANALVSTMQTLTEQRPDLANAQFDFQSDNGSIKVTSNTLSDSDKTWLQNLLNSNGSLVQAVHAFHSDAVSGYAQWAEADGAPLTDAQSQAISKTVDRKTNFMDIFQQLNTQGAQWVSEGGGTLEGSNGSKIDFSQNAKTAAGFLSFMQSAQIVENGADRYVESNGTVSYGGIKGDLFDQSLMPDFFPTPSTSIGVHETA
ncbi:hypothetical protein CIC12_21795 [Burkholderia sp. SG-MS1]|uniref:hypothetical protein n=1 Tax=Paraburkholderia sp. SG-MS1 TaxID=2023741 RepID=UPI0014453328|nr:hypothetical protein [Paraburkholderia sp. SG-MS1]NKJ49315.1 hypothetical protein [Paraburkholderia sp. SG-MS1]